MSLPSQPENVPPSGASLRLKPRWAWALTAPGRWCSWGRTVPRRRELLAPPRRASRRRRSARRGRGRPRPDRGRRDGHQGAGGEDATLRHPCRPPPRRRTPESPAPGSREQVEVAKRPLDLAPRPLLRLRDGVRRENSLYPGLQQLRRRRRIREHPPDGRGVPLAQREDDRQRYRALDEVGPDPLAHEAGLADEVHDVVGHLEGDAQSLPVGRQRVDLREREPAQGPPGHARHPEEPGGLLPYVLQGKPRPRRSAPLPCTAQISRREPH
jgi:hypothetical protein